MPDSKQELRNIVAGFKSEDELNQWVRQRSIPELRRLAAGDDIMLQVLLSTREDARGATQH